MVTRQPPLPHRGAEDDVGVTRALGRVSHSERRVPGKRTKEKFIWQERTRQQSASIPIGFRSSRELTPFSQPDSGMRTSQYCSPTTRGPKTSHMRRTPRLRKAPLREQVRVEPSAVRLASWLE